MGSTTLSAKIAAIAASTALPPMASISSPALDPSGWFVTTMPCEPVAASLNVSNVVPAEERHCFITRR